MSKLSKHISFWSLVLLLALAVSNPEEHQFLERVAIDYGKLHGGMELSIKELIHMGESNRTSYFIFSVYSYKFGNIGVKYFGIALTTFFWGSYRLDKPNENQDLVAYVIE